MPKQRDRLDEISLEMRRRVQSERIRYFKPVSPSDKNAFGIPSNDQVGFFESEAYERWVLGGNRSGKTEVAVADCIKLVTGEHPVWSKIFKPPVKVRYCAPSY